LSDVSIALREQERDAFQRLIRVIGHEINNSLTPIKSIAGSLRSLILVSPLPQESTDQDRFNLDRGLKIIENRAESLNRFIQAYRQLAQLPPPALQPVLLHSLMERVVALETRVTVRLNPGPDIVLQMDPDQMEQLVINLVRNAAEAALARFPEVASNGHITTDVPEVSITWRTIPQALVILILDNGVGLSNPSNLFVPFYTTKPGGSGIGLALARQICEAHGGVLQVSNRLDGPGCGAEIRLPLPFRKPSFPQGKKANQQRTRCMGEVACGERPGMPVHATQQASPLDGCPMFAPPVPARRGAYMGRKWCFRMLLLASLT
jgi:two-component system nitrogen regulation sensor histidine kinase NtrY